MPSSPERARPDWAARLPSDWIVPDWPVPATVRAVMTTRSDLLASGERIGSGAAPFDAFNLGLNVADQADAVTANRTELARRIGVKPAFMNQVHGTAAARADEGLCEADSVWTDSAERACAVTVADCLPVLFCFELPGRAKPVLAAAHAGWRGLCGAQASHGVLEATVARIFEHNSSDVHVNWALDAAYLVASCAYIWLGPCIGKTEFEVGDEVREAFTAMQPRDVDHFSAGLNGKWHCDLQALARARLARMGFAKIWGNDGSPAWCSATQSARFFSHRASGGRTGRMAALIWVAD